MICLDCRVSNHEPCKGKSWCDCQHRLESHFQTETPLLPQRDIESTTNKTRKKKTDGNATEQAG